MQIIMAKRAEEELAWFKKHDDKIARKIESFLVNICETPYTGLGKPEALKHEFSGCWSRRINYWHRLVYKLQEGRIIVLQCRYHYG